MAAVQNTTAAPAIGQKIDNSRTRLAENFEMFLTMLTTQLKNQDPLSPMDGNQFTQQLVQMTSVEQQLLTNDLLKSIASQGNDDFGKAVDMIGTQVTSDWPARTLTPAGATWLYDLGKDAKSVDLEIRNSKGDLVWKARRKEPPRAFTRSPGTARSTAFARRRMSTSSRSRRSTPRTSPSDPASSSKASSRAPSRRTETSCCPSAAPSCR
jgi:flagellar hook assembly protein FlgD